MGQKKGSQPACRPKFVQPMEYRVEDRIEEKSERADHDHDLERHYKKDDDADTGTNLRYSFLEFLS